MQAPGSHQPRTWQGGSVPHSLRSSRFHSQGTLVLAAGPNNQIIKSNLRSSRNGIGIDMTQTTPRRRSPKRVANPTRASTLTALGERAEDTAPPVCRPAVDPLNPGSATQKTANIQTKQNGPTSLMTIRRKPSHRFPRNLSYTSNTRTRGQAEFHTSQTQISTLPAPIFSPLIQYPCHTDPGKAPSLSLTIT